MDEFYMCMQANKNNKKMVIVIIKILKDKNK
jgi:hypothetical protein